MPSKKGGYKIVSLGGLDLTGENLSLKGLYNALKISYGKPILLNGIVIDGESKKDALVQVDEGENVINIKHLYGYNLSVSSADAITVEVDSEGIELPVPEPEDDGKVVKVNVLGKYVLGEASEGGTKLYQHRVTAGPRTIIIISADNTEITNLLNYFVSYGSKVLCVGGQQAFTPLSFYIGIVPNGQGGDIDFYYIDNSGSIAKFEYLIATMAVTADTVTEL